MKIPKSTLYLIIGLIVGFDLLIAGGVYYWFSMNPGKEGDAIPFISTSSSFSHSTETTEDPVESVE
jgi:hypothetical protein